MRNGPGLSQWNPSSRSDMETSETSYGIQYVHPSMRSRSIWPGDPLGVSGVTQSLTPALHIHRAIFSLQNCVSKMDASTSVCNGATVFMD
ncbi:hypothetical protein Q8A73_014732 [Channa argus]|nr:hypothetical protein Q8A73_014732 [Channa argus]